MASPVASTPLLSDFYAKMKVDAGAELTDFGYLQSDDCQATQLTTPQIIAVQETFAEIRKQKEVTPPLPAALPSPRTAVQMLLIDHNFQLQEKLKKYQETHHRHSAAILESIMKHLVQTVVKTPELQVVLGIEFKEDAKPDIALILSTMAKFINAKDTTIEDDELKDFIIISKELKQINPIYTDLDSYLSSLNIDIESPHFIPDAIAKDLTEKLQKEITAHLESLPDIKKKLKSGIAQTLIFAWGAVNVMSTLGLLNGLDYLFMTSPASKTLEGLFNHLFSKK